MKPPYVVITATCIHKEWHGSFTLQRKPNNRERFCSTAQPWKYDAVRCPKCLMWAKIVSQVLVEKEEERPEPEPGLF